MKVESWQAYNPDAKIKEKLGNCLRISFRKTNTIIDYVREIDSNIVDDFISALQKRIPFVNSIDGIVEKGDILELIQDYGNLKVNHDLAILVTKYVFYHLKIPMELEDMNKETEVTSFDDACESERIMYYLAKAGADVVGEDNGIQFWKKVVAFRLRDDKIEYDEKIKEQENKGKK